MAGYSWINFGGSPFDTIPDWNRAVVLIPRHESHGDINGDGYDDFISDASGNFFDIYLGGAIPDTNFAFRWTTIHGSVPLVQDINNDGYDDLLFTRTARTDVYFGGVTVVDTISDAQLSFACGQDAGPYRATSIGDINGDGYGDVVEWTYWCPESWFGTLALHLGGVVISSDPVWLYNGWTAPYNVIGIADVKGMGDVNGDGIVDFAIGGFDDSAYLGLRGKAVVLGGIPLTAQGPRVAVPKNLAVSVYPNPFNSTTQIRFDLTHSTLVNLSIFDVLGRRVVTLLNDTHAAGSHHIEWNAETQSTGIYFVRLETASQSRTQKLVILK